MDRHEDIKNECARIMTYYGIDADTEYPLQNGQRIDVVGYFKNRNDPDIGIEVELTSDMAKDSKKLLMGVPNMQVRIIVSDKKDLMGINVITYVHKEINIVLPPDQSKDFEELIRKYTDSDNRPWFSNIKITGQSLQASHNVIGDFENDIRDQGLDINTAKDIMFRSALGGINTGFYQNKNGETRFHQSAEIPRELLYLEALGMIYEDRPGSNYESGRSSIYHVSENGRDLAIAIIKERVEEKRQQLLDLRERYGDARMMISLIGHMGSYVDRQSNTEFYRVSGLDAYDGTYIPYYFGPQDIPNDIVEKFSIGPQAIYASRIVASAPPFLDIVRDVYSSLVDEGLGNKASAIGTRGDSYGLGYYVPLRSILEILNISNWPDSETMDKLRACASWIIMRSHNPNVPETLYNSLKAIGVTDMDAKSMFDDLVKNGITSKPVKSGAETMAIYDKRKFNEYCESRIQEALGGLLDE